MLRRQSSSMRCWLQGEVCCLFFFLCEGADIFIKCSGAVGLSLSWWLSFFWQAALLVEVLSSGHLLASRPRSFLLLCWGHGWWCCGSTLTAPWGQAQGADWVLWLSSGACVSLGVPWCPQDTQCQQGIGPVQVEMCSGISLCGGVSTVGKEVVGPQCCRQLLAVR